MGLKTQVVIVTPALADANNGNWQTARRWAAHLAAVARVRLVKVWPDADAAGDEVMIALQTASVSFQEMVQVRNKLVTAYQDVMNIQV